MDSRRVQQHVEGTLQHGLVPCHTVKTTWMGEGGNGKTATCHSMMGLAFDPQLERTNGISIHGMALSESRSTRQEGAQLQKSVVTSGVVAAVVEGMRTTPEQQASSAAGAASHVNKTSPSPSPSPSPNPHSTTRAATKSDANTSSSTSTDQQGESGFGEPSALSRMLLT